MEAPSSILFQGEALRWEILKKHDPDAIFHTCWE